MVGGEDAASASRAARHKRTASVYMQRGGARDTYGFKFKALSQRVSAKDAVMDTGGAQWKAMRNF